MLADNTLLKTVCQFLLLLVGFDTRTYRKDYDRSPTLVGHLVARICYLCAGAVYVVLLGSPTGSITLVSYLREIPTVAVLHHPFLFGEIPT